MDLIYDRTQLDVTNKTSKGYHNISDLNRVETASRELADLLTSYGYPINIITKTDWAITDMRTASEMERIKTNIAAIKNAYYVMTTTPALPDTINKIDVDKANAIEKILADIDVLIGNMAAQWTYAGDMYSGRGF